MKPVQLHTGCDYRHDACGMPLKQWGGSCSQDFTAQGRYKMAVMLTRDAAMLLGCGAAYIATGMPLALAFCSEDALRTSQQPQVAAAWHTVHVQGGPCLLYKQLHTSTYLVIVQGTCWRHSAAAWRWAACRR